MMFGLHLFHSHTKVNPKTLFLFCQMKTFNNHDASHCSVLKYKLTKDGARAATAMTSFVRLLPLCKKIIPGIECAICVEYCLGAPYRPLPGFLRWVARYFWSDDDTLFQFDVQRVVINGEAWWPYLVGFIVIADFYVISESFCLFYVTWQKNSGHSCSFRVSVGLITIIHGICVAEMLLSVL